MAEQDAQDRNLPASARKIQRSREQGQLPRSRDLPHFTVLAVAAVLLSSGLPHAVDALQVLLQSALRFDAQTLSKPGVMTERLAQQVWLGLQLGLPALLAIVGAAMAGHLASGGWNWTLQPLAPKFSHLNPISGLGRLFQWQQLSQALKACLLALVLGGIGALVLKNKMSTYIAIMTVPLPAALAYAGSLILNGLAMLGLALALFAAVDVPLQRQLYLRRLRMSREEAKQEMKETEGNMELKQRQRARAREIARTRMLAAVPQADLVVMNPTHYAVALKYEDGRMGAPRVVAKGVDSLAMRIRDLARESKVPVLQAPVLARALYAHTKVDHEVPAALFAAVAQVLAYVYQLKAALAQHSTLDVPPPNPDVPPELDPHNREDFVPDELDLPDPAQTSRGEA
ncbi:flagellar biosynthesis protein FlhB [Roseateles sp. BYS180W]|uniref:Flagellar biosynthesis protein FlhB n=1 Tax=Roseateles rivi TaxID=3299028 RepID=A0ABW7FV96_9BURK